MAEWILNPECQLCLKCKERNRLKFDLVSAKVTVWEENEQTAGIEPVRLKQNVQFVEFFAHLTGKQKHSHLENVK